MTPEERAAHCQRIGHLGGQATVKTFGHTHMSAIGKRGFQAALDLGYGDYLLTKEPLKINFPVWLPHSSVRGGTVAGSYFLTSPKLAPSYRAKFGRDPVVGRNPAGAAARAQARRDTPTLGRCSWHACTVPATQRHHVDGWTNGPDTCGFCAAHHTAFERAYRAAYARHRPYARTHEPPTRRAVALSIGVGLDDAVPY